MTPIRETIARVYVETIIGKPDPDWAAHWQWYLDGAGNPDSCVHYSNHGRGAQHADAVLRALDAEGWRVVPSEPDQRMVGAYITSVRGMPRADRRLRDLTHKEWSKQHAEKCAFRWRAMLAAAPKVTE